MQRAVLSNDLESLFALKPEFVENAKPDSLWQIAILHGVLNRVPLVGRLLSYEVPTYFGMLCASYLPVS
jgi:aromatic ring-opening dioxygenase LigB subunit